MSTNPQNQLPWELAQAVHDSVQGAHNLEARLRELRPSAEIIAQAIELSFFEQPFARTAATRELLAEYLQIVLTREHIAAQKRMSRTVTALNVVLVFLTAALAWFGWTEYRKPVDRPPPPSTVEVAPQSWSSSRITPRP